MTQIVQIDRVPAPATIALLLIVALALHPRALASERISGTYIAHGDQAATMLQLTQTDNGQVSGLSSTITVDKEGKISASDVPFTGVFDGGQIALSFHGAGFSGLSTANLAGTVRGNTITIQSIGGNGIVSSTIFTRASADSFKAYADQIRTTAKAIRLDARLTAVANGADETLASTRAWFSYAQKQMERVPQLKERYDSVENRMRELLEKEQSTVSVVERSQISVAISQLNVTVGDWDADIDMTWQRILSELATLDRNYSKIGLDCAFPEDTLRAGGASHAVIDRWRSACQSFTSGKQKAIPGCRVITQARVSLKMIQNGARERRQAFIRRSDRLAAMN